MSKTSNDDLPPPRLRIPKRPELRYRSVRLRSVISTDYGLRCAYCLVHQHAGGIGAIAMESDHLIAHSQSGSDAYENLRWSCKRCNNGKRAAPATHVIDPVAEWDWGVHIQVDEENESAALSPRGGLHIQALKKLESLALKTARSDADTLRELLAEALKDLDAETDEVEKVRRAQLISQLRGVLSRQLPAKETYHWPAARAFLPPTD